LQILNPEILARLSNGSCLWAGHHPPRSDMDDGTALFDPQRDFRLGPDLHQKYDLVFLLEKDLAASKQWPLILDEALRAVKPGGILLLRLMESGLLSIFQLANAVEKWTKGEYALIDQVSDNGRFLLAVQLTHDTRRSASPDDLTFALITDGRKPEAVSAFVDSVLRLPPLAADPYEILICGPPSVMTDVGSRSSQVKWIPQPEEFSDLGWITRKKNLLVDAATRENIVVAHDRYVIPADFITRLRDFGGDFDVVAPRQTSTTGQPLPDWVMLSDHLNWTTPGWLEFGDYHPFGYVNGGVIVAKTECLRRTRWSELLFWGQAEDVDLSRRLQDAGATPRPARNITLISEPPRVGFVEGFERIAWIDELYARSPRPDREHVSTTGPLALAVAPTTFVRMGEAFVFKDRTGIHDAADAGYIFERDWSVESGNLIWQGDGEPQLSLKTNGPHIDITLTLTFMDAAAAADLAAVKINGIDETPLSRCGPTVDISVPQTALTDSNILHIWLKTCSGKPALAAVELNGAPRPVQRTTRRRR